MSTEGIEELQATIDQVSEKTGCRSHSDCHDWLEDLRKLKDEAGRTDDVATKSRLAGMWDDRAALYHLVNQQMAAYSLLDRCKAGEKYAIADIPDMIAALKGELD